MRVGSAAALAAAAMIAAHAPAAVAAAQAPSSGASRPQAPPAAPAPGGTTTPAAGTTPPSAGQGGAASPPAIGVPATPTAPPARAFTAPVGLLFNTVRPERVADFEKVIAYLQSALSSSTDPNVQAQARGWRMYKASEPGPNGTVLYVFVMDPTVPGSDYGLGRILAAAYPDQAQLQEIWRLYTSSVTSGGSLLNLTPLMPALPPPPGGAPPAALPRMLPPDANPNQPGR